MIGIVVAAHNELADALVQTARGVVTTQVPVVALAIQTADSSTEYEAKLRQAISEADRGGGVLVLTDMFGGTPSNVGMTMHDPGRVEVLTGVNLPMVIKALHLGGSAGDLTVVAQAVKSAGQRSIVVASELLEPAPAPPVHTREEPLP